MKTIDVIIPAYEAHDTIRRCLASILMQLNIDNIDVTIVNDGGEDYQDIVKDFSNMMSIKEIGYEDNMGPGYARNYGIEHTNNRYIMFIDADDAFEKPIALSALEKEMNNNPRTGIMLSKLVEYYKEDECVIQPHNLIWLHGNLYKRSIIRKYNIRFLNNYAKEDLGFNKKYHMASLNECDGTDEAVRGLDLITYNWLYNKESIDRNNSDIYKIAIIYPGSLYNSYSASMFGIENNFEIKYIMETLLNSLFDAYYYFNIALYKNTVPEAIKIIEDISRKIFYDLYDTIMDNVEEDEFNRYYQESYENKEQELSDISLRYNLEEFTKLMFSKDPIDIDYEEVEQDMFDLIYGEE